MSTEELSEQKEALIEYQYSRLSKIIRRYEANDFEVEVLEKYRYGNTLGAVLKVTCKHELCRIADKVEYQCDVDVRIWKPKWYLMKRSITSSRTRHTRLCLKSICTILETIRFSCECGYPVGTYSPNCSSRAHRPALPDEIMPFSILEYKRNRLLYMVRYLVQRHLTYWFYELYNDYLPFLELSHTYMYTLPVLRTGSSKLLTEVDLSVKCYLCSSMIQASQFEEHIRVHVNHRRRRLAIALGLPEDFSGD